MKAPKINPFSFNMDFSISTFRILKLKLNLFVFKKRKDVFWNLKHFFLKLIAAKCFASFSGGRRHHLNVVSSGDQVTVVSALVKEKARGVGGVCRPKTTANLFHDLQFKVK